RDDFHDEVDRYGKRVPLVTSRLGHNRGIHSDELTFGVDEGAPLLPGLTAASVCMNASMPNRSLMRLIFRPLALTMPAVIVDERLKGLPTASTHSPICTSSESEGVRVCKPRASIFRRARSVVGSTPTTSATCSSLSGSPTITCPAFLMTW